MPTLGTGFAGSVMQLVAGMAVPVNSFQDTRDNGIAAFAREGKDLESGGVDGGFQRGPQQGFCAVETSFDSLRQNGEGIGGFDNRHAFDFAQDENLSKAIWQLVDFPLQECLDVCHGGAAFR